MFEFSQSSTKESLSSEETENPLANAFKRLNWSKIMPKSNGCYTIYVGQTPVTVTVRTEDLPVGHSSPKSIDSNNDLNTDDTRGEKSTDVS